MKNRKKCYVPILCQLYVTFFVHDNEKMRKKVNIYLVIYGNHLWSNKWEKYYIGNQKSIHKSFRQTSHLPMIKACARFYQKMQQKKNIQRKANIIPNRLGTNLVPDLVQGYIRLATWQFFLQNTEKQPKNNQKIKKSKIFWKN